jgi:hypothetical protein
MEYIIAKMKGTNSRKSGEVSGLLCSSTDGPIKKVDVNNGTPTINAVAASMIPKTSPF